MESIVGGGVAVWLKDLQLQSVFMLLQKRKKKDN